MKKIIFSIGIFILIIFISNIASATTISVTPEEPNVGDEITVTITVPNVHTSSVTANISGVVTGTIKVVGGDLSGEAKDYSKSAKFTCSKQGNVDIEISSDSSAVLNGQYVNVAAKKTIVVKEKQTTPPTSDTSGSGSTTEPEKPATDKTPEPAKKSSEARLKNFGINPKEYDFSGFSKNPDKEDWSAEVPNSVTSVEVYAEPKDSKATVTGTGKVTLNEGNNKIGVKVKAEDGTTKTYTLTIKRKTAAEENSEKGENRLSSLSIKPKEYDFSGFNSDKTEYTAEVPNDVKEIEIVAKAKDSNAQVTGTGMIELKEGENELKIEVIAVNGDKKTYTLTVTRKEAEKKETLGLSILSIKNLTLNPSFKLGTYEYKVELKEDLEALEIVAKANSKDATVEIVGNKELKQGENIITILVENKKTEEIVTYQIIVNKNVATIVEENVQTSWLKPSTWGKEEIIKLVIIVVLIILIICAVLLKINISKENKKDKKVQFPGANELDKAIAEHQELVEEEITTEENIIEDKTEINIEEQNYIEQIARDRFKDMESIKDEKPKKRGRHF